MIVPSKYQQAIYEAFEHTGDSLLVESVAGSGKTHTLVELANIMQRAFPEQRAVFVAFNKSIADELARRISASNVRAMTLHSAGWFAWRRAGGLEWEPRVKNDKVSVIMREVLSYEENKRFGETTRKLVGYAKGIGLVPTQIPITREAHGMWDIVTTGLVDDTPAVWEGLIDHYGLDEAECNIPLVRKVLARSIELGRETCDFDDMLMLPVIAGVPFDQYDVVLVDEAQDVSGIQMEMISRMVKPGGRVIAVGDRKQSIYGFRGAGTESMDILQRRFQMRPLPLSVSYRCPVAVVEHARQWVPQIEARPAMCSCSHAKSDHNYQGCKFDDTCACQSYTESDPGAPWGFVGLEGSDWAGQAEVALGAPLDMSKGRHDAEITDLATGLKYSVDWATTTGRPGYADPVVEGVSKWRGIQDFLPGDAILCRLTRPVVAAAFALIRRRVACHVLGRDIGKGLVDLARRSKRDSVRDLLDWLDDYQRREGERLRRKQKFAQAGLMDDRCETLRCFCAEVDENATVAEVVRMVEGLFSDGNGGMAQMVTLATCHKAKGLEFDRVFILDAGQWMPCPWSRQGWELAQERNIQYVAATRAKHELRYIKSSDLGVGL